MRRGCNKHVCQQALGGAKYHFLTHQDDVAGHDKWHEALGTERLIHSTETNTSQGTECVSHTSMHVHMYMCVCVCVCTKAATQCLQLYIVAQMLCLHLSD